MLIHYRGINKFMDILIDFTEILIMNIAVRLILNNFNFASNDKRKRNKISTLNIKSLINVIYYLCSYKNYLIMLSLLVYPLK